MRAENNIQKGYNIFWASVDDRVSWADKNPHSEARAYVLKNMLPKIDLGNRVLDFGCGDGKLCHYLFDFLYAEGDVPFEYCGIDISDFAVDELKKMTAAHPHGSKMTFYLNSEWPEADGENIFDTVFLLDVLEHIIDKDAILYRVGRLLKPSGKLIFTMPTSFNLVYTVQKLAHRIVKVASKSKFNKMESKTDIDNTPKVNQPYDQKLFSYKICLLLNKYFFVDQFLGIKTLPVELIDRLPHKLAQKIYHHFEERSLLRYISTGQVLAMCRPKK